MRKKGSIIAENIDREYRKKLIIKQRLEEDKLKNSLKNNEVKE